MTRTVILMLFMALAAITSQILVKTSMNQVGPVSLTLPAMFEFIRRQVTNPAVIIGGLLYLMSFAFWLVILTRANLSFAYPVMTGILVIFSLTASVLILHETVGWLQLVGVGLIFAGLFLAFLK